MAMRHGSSGLSVIGRCVRVARTPHIVDTYHIWYLNHADHTMRGRTITIRDSNMPSTSSNSNDEPCLCTETTTLLVNLRSYNSTTDAHLTTLDESCRPPHGFLVTPTCAGLSTRSCSMYPHFSTTATVPASLLGSGTSYCASCMLGSNLSPAGSKRATPKSFSTCSTASAHTIVTSWQL